MGYGRSGIVVIARAGPVDGPGVPGCAVHSGPTLGAGPMNPSGVRLQLGRPGAGSMNLKSVLAGPSLEAGALNPDQGELLEQAGRA